jgi:hypothetical protein
MKTLSTKYQKGIWGCIIVLFGFIVYRKYIIHRIYDPTFQEGLKAGGGNLVEETGKKIQLLQKRGKGQHEKMKDIDVRIKTINKELDRKLNQQRQ